MTDVDPLEELFRESYSMLRWVARNAKIEEDDLEDAVHTLFEKFIEWGGLEKYDPYRLHDTGASPEVPGDRYRRAKLTTFMRAWALKAVLTLRDKQEVRHRRVPWRLDAPVRPGNPAETWAEHPAYAVDTIEAVENQIVIRVAIGRAREILVSTKTTESRDYDRLLDLILAGFCLDGEVDRSVIQRELGVSKNLLTKMIAEVRGTLETLLADSGLRPAS